MLKREHIRFYLKPIIRAFLRHGYSIHDLIQIGKELFVEAAQEEIKRTGGKVNISRISVMTGLYRREVSEHLRGTHSPSDHGASLIARILARWQTSPEYADGPNGPRPLQWRSGKSDFSSLVYSVSKDTHDGTILNELKRAGIVKVEGELIYLERREAFVPGDLNRAMRIIETNLEGCLRSAEENILLDPTPRNIHLRTSYDNLYIDKLPEIKEWILEAGKDFHQRIREYLARFDKDSTVSVGNETSEGARLIVSSFSFAESPPTRAPRKKSALKRSQAKQ